MSVIINNLIKLSGQLAYGTSVILLRCPLVPEKMHGGAPEAFFH